MLQVKVLNPKAKKILTELASLKLIHITEEKELFPLSKAHKKSIALSRRQIKNGQVKSTKEVLDGLRKWVKAGNLVASC